MTKLHITIISVFPELHEPFFRTGLTGRAEENGLVSYSHIRLADCAQPKERIDVPACGPGAGMVIKAEIAGRALELAVERYGRGFTVFFSPQAALLTQPAVRSIAEHLLSEPSDSGVVSTNRPAHLILFCGRYEGVDERVELVWADAVFSIGNYVLMGGDLPAQVFLEAILRYVPGVIGKSDSVERDSFSGPFVDYPAYGLPVEWQGHAVPDILRSGDHGRIEQWRKEVSCQRTLKTQFAWLRQTPMEQQDVAFVAAQIPPHYAVLMHDQVLIGRQQAEPGVTSVTTIDLHDMARSATTYGIKKFFIVTPLEDQHAVLKVFFEFWHTNAGKEYNVNRYDAMQCIKVVHSLAEVLMEIEVTHGGERPLMIATSAKQHAHSAVIDYTSQGQVWQQRKPVLLVFGTGQGLIPELVEACDYLLLPVCGFSAYNHLSVRSAVAVVFDRWIGYWSAALQKDD